MKNVTGVLMINAASRQVYELFRGTEEDITRYQLVKSFVIASRSMDQCNILTKEQVETAIDIFEKAFEISEKLGYVVKKEEKV